MFDGMLDRDDGIPGAGPDPTVSAWSWEFAALVFATVALLVLAAVLFPNMLVYPIDRF